MSLGLEMAVPVVLFGFVGYQIDRRTGTQSAWMIGGGVLGMVVAFYQLFKRIQMLSQANPDGTYPSDSPRADGDRRREDSE